MERTVEEVASLRARLWDVGLRPVEIYNVDVEQTEGGKPIEPESRGKVPRHGAWQKLAQRNPPDAVKRQPSPNALNTGLWCGGLRPIDIDIDNMTIAQACRDAALDIFGDAPIRFRRGSPRCTLLYRAATGEPLKRSLPGTFGKVEILGHGQQFVAFGLHYSGAELEWLSDRPDEGLASSIPAITEDQVSAFLERIAPIIDAKPPQKPNGKDHTPSAPQADFFRIADAVSVLPNEGPADWEAWNRWLMAIWNATGGSAAGREIARLWSAKHPAHDEAEFDARWKHYPDSPPDFIGAGSLFHAARQVREAEIPPPSRETDYGTAPVSPEVERIRPTVSVQPTDIDGKSILPLEYFADIHPVTQAQDFVEGLLIDQTMSVIYGESNSGKTFFTTNLAFHVAAGWPWEGREVERGAVIYCALEGGHGIRNRVSALSSHYALDGHNLPFAIVPVSVNMLDPEQDIRALIRTIRHVSRHFDLPVRLTVMDTLSRAMAGGNENAPDDMGALVTNGALIQQETGSHLCWVHHSGKDQAKGARGHSLLRAATDTEIEITAGETGRLGRVTKQRDMECVGEFPFKLKVIELGENHRGKMVTSCVVVGLDEGETASNGRLKSKRALPANAQLVLRALSIAMSKTGAQLPPTADYPANTTAVSATEWRTEFDQLKAGSSADTRKHAFNNGQTVLLAQEIITAKNGLVWFVKRGMEPST